jgi:hypothetical protein
LKRGIDHEMTWFSTVLGSNRVMQTFIPGRSQKGVRAIEVEPVSCRILLDAQANGLVVMFAAAFVIVSLFVPMPISSASSR